MHLRFPSLAAHSQDPQHRRQNGLQQNQEQNSQNEQQKLTEQFVPEIFSSKSGVQTERSHYLPEHRLFSHRNQSPIHRPSKTAAALQNFNARVLRDSHNESLFDSTLHGFGRNVSTWPELTTVQKTLLYKTLPNMIDFSDKAAHSTELRSATMHIIISWLLDKLHNSNWMQTILSIQRMSEGDLPSGASADPALHKSLAFLGIDRHSLETAGIPHALITRLYKAIWVYSLGVHEIINECTYHCESNEKNRIIGAIWKVYGLLISEYCPKDYALALICVEKASQKALEQIESRVSEHLTENQKIKHEMKQKMKELRQQIEILQLEKKQLIQKLENMKLQSSSQEQLLSIKEKKLLESKQKFYDVQNAFESFERTSMAAQSQANGKIKELQDELAECKRQFLQASELLQNNSAEFTNLTFRYGILKSKVASLESTNEQLQAALVSHKNRSEKLESNCAQFELLNRRLKDEIINMKSTKNVYDKATVTELQLNEHGITDSKNIISDLQHQLAIKAKTILLLNEKFVKLRNLFHLYQGAICNNNQLSPLHLKNADFTTINASTSADKLYECGEINCVNDFRIAEDVLRSAEALLSSLEKEEQLPYRDTAIEQKQSHVISLQQQAITFNTQLSPHESFLANELQHSKENCERLESYVNDLQQQLSQKSAEIKLHSNESNFMRDVNAALHKELAEFKSNPGKNDYADANECSHPINEVHVLKIRKLEQENMMLLKEREHCQTLAAELRKMYEALDRRLENQTTKSTILKKLLDEQMAESNQKVTHFMEQIRALQNDAVRHQLTQRDSKSFQHEQSVDRIAVSSPTDSATTFDNAHAHMNAAQYERNRDVAAAATLNRFHGSCTQLNSLVMPAFCNSAKIATHDLSPVSRDFVQRLSNTFAALQNDAVRHQLTQRDSESFQHEQSVDRIAVSSPTDSATTFDNAHAHMNAAQYERNRDVAAAAAVNSNHFANIHVSVPLAEQKGHKPQALPSSVAINVHENAQPTSFVRTDLIDMQSHLYEDSSTIPNTSRQPVTNRPRNEPSQAYLKQAIMRSMQ